jgi:hypothetical protein
MLMPTPILAVTMRDSADTRVRGPSVPLGSLRAQRWQRCCRPARNYSEELCSARRFPFRRWPNAGRARHVAASSGSPGSSSSRLRTSCWALCSHRPDASPPESPSSVRRPWWSNGQRAITLRASRWSRKPRISSCSCGRAPISSQHCLPFLNAASRAACGLRARRPWSGSAPGSTPTRSWAEPDGATPPPRGPAAH